ncbi:MAG: hypothetical protein RMY29_030420 [Nostoc sp. CreGUA01]|nr:hypothetical protein [Nostoc sp. CreGUA01]
MSCQDDFAPRNWVSFGVMQNYGSSAIKTRFLWSWRSHQQNILEKNAIAIFSVLRSHKKYMFSKMQLLLYCAGDRTNKIFSKKMRSHL